MTSWTQLTLALLLHVELDWLVNSFKTLIKSSQLPIMLFKLYISEISYSKNKREKKDRFNYQYVCS